VALSSLRKYFNQDDWKGSDEPLGAALTVFGPFICSTPPTLTSGRIGEKGAKTGLVTERQTSLRRDMSD